MISRRVFAVLTTLLVILVVAAAILLAFQSLLAALGDATAASFVLWIAIGCVILLAIDIVLLVGALGINAMRSHDDSRSE